MGGSVERKKTFFCPEPDFVPLFTTFNSPHKSTEKDEIYLRAASCFALSVFLFLVFRSPTITLCLVSDPASSTLSRSRHGRPAHCVRRSGPHLQPSPRIWITLRFFAAHSQAASTSKND